ncbi:unnamed protein product [Clavelina lepadiformis]|uniref:Uncharacterized protein n=1 Tax=Clavelina lepadiformis TaxID=159417 RepID=A0ABP0GBP1_CLALP
MAKNFPLKKSMQTACLDGKRRNGTCQAPSRYAHESVGLKLTEKLPGRRGTSPYIPSPICPLRREQVVD